MKGGHAKREIWLWLSKPMGSHFGVAPPILVYFSGDRDWDVHWGHRLLTHGHMRSSKLRETASETSFSLLPVPQLFE